MMKTLLAFLLLSAGSALAQAPDPRDSIIVESKLVAPGNAMLPLNANPAYMTVRVFFSNKDTLANVSLFLEERSLSGGAYAIWSYGPNNPGDGGVGPAREDDFSGSFIHLLPSPQLSTLVGSSPNYTGTPPDTFMWTGTASPPTGPRLVPPGPTRPLVDILFDSVWNNIGQFEIDTGKILNYRTSLVTRTGVEVKPNFVKGIITVLGKGDLNLDGSLTSADAVLMLNGVFCAACELSFSRQACDMNCDGLPTPADVVLHLNAVFLGIPFPC